MRNQEQSRDEEPEFVTTSESKRLRRGVIDLVKKYGSERIAKDGVTATFQLDGLRVMTCRYITKDGEYGRGVYINLWEELTNYPDGSSIQWQRNYELDSKGAVYYAERAVHFDADEEEIPFSHEKPEGMSTLIWNRARRKFLEKFDDHSFYRFQLEEIEYILSGVNEVHVVACEDETVEGA